MFSSVGPWKQTNRVVSWGLKGRVRCVDVGVHDGSSDPDYPCTSGIE